MRIRFLNRIRIQKTIECLKKMLFKYLDPFSE